MLASRDYDTNSIDASPEYGLIRQASLLATSHNSPTDLAPLPLFHRSFFQLLAQADGDPGGKKLHAGGTPTIAD
mgnify:CR=1 FL=1